MTQSPAERPMPSREELSLCAHDLRGALTVIAGYTGLLRRGGLTPGERTAALDGIDAAIKRIDCLIGETLSSTRPVTADASAPSDVCLLAEQAAADARVAFGRKVNVACDGETLVSTDEVALARALENLLSNAARYAPDGAIDIRVERAGDRVLIEVADRGPGIPELERETVFEPFARLNEDADVPGTGLGLTVVRSVAERAGGSAVIHERSGGGTVVRLELPAAG